VSPLVRIIALRLALTASVAQAQEPATTSAPEPAAIDGAEPARAEDQERVAERLRFIHERLKAEAVQARTWEAGWSIVYIGGLGYASYELANAHSASALTQGAIGAGQSLIGAMTMGLLPLKASRGAHELESAHDADDSPERLRLAESLLRRNAAETELRYSWKPHVISIAMNLIGGAAIWIAGDLRRGAQSAGIAIAVGELQIWTQPWQAARDLREYRQRFGGLAATSTTSRAVATSLAVHISATQLAITF
jgi:hypothetical protein